MRLRPVLVTLFAGWLAGLATPAAAQNNSGIQFDFSLSGARSLGLGGAFVPLADDATAAWANPAGLTILTKKEVSAELRTWRFKNFITDRGHGFGTASGIGIDTVTGLFDSESVDSTLSPAFLSFVVPFPRWSFAGYRHQVSNVEAHITSTLRRLGAWFDPDHRLRFESDDPLVRRLKVLYRPGSNNIHIHIPPGAGIAFRSFQIDAAFDIFKQINTVAVSTVYRVLTT